MVAVGKAEAAVRSGAWPAAPSCGVAQAGLSGAGQGLGAVAAPGGAAAGLMLCDRGGPRPTTGSLPPHRAVGSLALAGVCAGVCGGWRAHVCHGGPAAVADGHRLREPENSWRKTARAV